MIVLEIQKKIDDIKNRLDEINNLFDIYNINDEESMNYFINEIQSYKEELKKISDEKLKRTNK
jgi:hypothetical protein